MKHSSWQLARMWRCIVKFLKAVETGSSVACLSQGITFFPLQCSLKESTYQIGAVRREEPPVSEVRLARQVGLDGAKMLFDRISVAKRDHVGTRDPPSTIHAV